MNCVERISFCVLIWSFCVIKANGRSDVTNQMTHRCPPIITKDGETVICHTPNNQLRINCTLEASPEYTLALFKCEKFWHWDKDSSKTVKQVCLNQNWVREHSNLSCIPECGLRKNLQESLGSRIRSTTPNGQHVFPWVVRLFAEDVAEEEDRIPESGHFKYICQGTLISDRAILTAAECVTFRNSSVERRPEDLSVVFGEMPSARPLPKYVEVEKIVLHQQYEVSTLANNLAMIWLKRPTQLNSQTTPVCLFTNVSKSDGFGGEKTTMMIPVTIQDEEMNLIQMNSGKSINCPRKYSDVMNIASHTLCVQFEPKISLTSKHSSTCDLNGAGLFQVTEDTDSWRLRGIYTGTVLPGKGQSESSCHGQKIFTDLAPMRVWIDKELTREPPVYDDEKQLATFPEQSSSTTPPSYSFTPRRSTYGPKHPEKEREPLTPEPFLIPHHHISRPVEAETFSEHRNHEDKGWTQNPLKSHAQAPTTEMTNIHTSSKRHSNVTPFYGLIPTRFPISTSRPTSTTDKSSRSTTSTSTATQRSTGTPLHDHTHIYDINSNKHFACPPLERPPAGVTQVCKHDQYEDIDDCSNGGYIGTDATLKCSNHYKPAFGPSMVKKECMPDKRWSVTRALSCNLECGISSSPRRPLIVNGIVSDRISWPWHATVFRKLDNETKYICGGTLISKTLLVTAAHCITVGGTTRTVDKEEFRVILATKSINYTENLLDPISKSNLFYVKSTVIPDSYNGVTFESDIGLIQLEYEVEISDFVKPVCFPFQSRENAEIELLQLSPGTFGQTVGFGIDESGYLSKVLREMSMPIISYRECGEVLGRFPSPSQFCAGYLNGTAVCNGDSGSGLFFSIGTGYSNRYIIQGLVSFGAGDQSASTIKTCNHGTYAVFTKVSSFAPWIESKMDVLEPTYSR